MDRKDSDEDEVGLEVAYFELVAARPTMALLRLGGRWSGVDAADLGPATLVLEAEGQEHRLPALPEAQGADAEEASIPWRAAFAAPVGTEAARSATYRLDAGPVVVLPSPVERRLGRETAAAPEPEPDAPAEPAVLAEPIPPEPAAALVPPARAESTEAATARPGSRRRVAPRLVAVAVLVIVALLIIVAVATSGGDGSEGDDGREPSALMDVLPMGATASGEILRDGDGRLVLRLRGLQGRRSAVWLFNSVIDARLVATLGAPTGTIALPSPSVLRRFRYVDVSREDDDNANHSGLSVLRVPTADVR
jgi:hypothetical protein